LQTSQSREGDLAKVGFCEILAELCRNQETGVLRLSGGTADKSVFLQDGNIIFASSKDPDDRLGELLLTREVIHRQQLEEATHQVGPSKRLGTVLVEMGILPAEDLPRWVREQVKEILFSLFSWTDGSYRFEAGPIPSSEAITLRLSTAEIFLSGLRQVQKWSVLRKGAGEIRLPYRLSPDREAFRELTLGEDEKTLLTLLQSKPTTMEQAALESGLSTLRVYQLFFAFRVLGVVVPHAAPVAAQLPSASDAPAAKVSEAPRVAQSEAAPQSPEAPGKSAQPAPVQTAPAKELKDRAVPKPLPPAATVQVEPGVMAGAEPPAVASEVGAQTVIFKMPIPEPAAGKKGAGATPPRSPVEAAVPVAPVISDSEPAKKQASEKSTKGPNPSLASLSPRPAPPANKGAAAGSESGHFREATPATPNIAKRPKQDFRIVRVEGDRLDGNGAQQIEDLLKQWSGKGYRFAGVVPGKKEGLFGSSGSCFFVFERDPHS
jgi:hypothetical protein